jgi:hypothetical protein
MEQDMTWRAAARQPAMLDEELARIRRMTR